MDIGAPEKPVISQFADDPKKLYLVYDSFFLFVCFHLFVHVQSSGFTSPTYTGFLVCMLIYFL